MPATLRTPRPHLALAAATALLGGAYACAESTAPDAGLRRVYGAPVTVGAGTARSYVLMDDAPGGGPAEVGVALSEGALEKLPAPMSMPDHGGGAHAHADSHEYLLPLPAENGTGYQLVEMNWNPGGHEPPGIYDVPHFDFHFYTIGKAERDAIVPTDARYAAKAAHAPPAEAVPAFYFNPSVALNIPPAAAAVPRMGMHWMDGRAPELQGALGRPEAYRPFTTTFIHGAWDGRFIFDEPMVTRAFILGRKAAAAPAQRDTVMALTAAAAYAAPGYRPSAYRVTYDAAAREYRVALQLVRHD